MKELGVYTKEDAKVTADYNDAMANLGKAFRSFAGIVFRMVLPGVKKIIDAFTQGVVFLRKHETFVKAFFLMLATLITTMVIPAFVKLAAAIYANPLTWLVAAIAAIALAIEDLVVWAEGGESAFADFWAAIFGSPEEAQQTWENVKNAVSEFIDSAVNGFNEFIQMCGKVIYNMTHIGETWDIIAGAIGKRIDQMIAWFSSLGDAIKNAFSGALNMMPSFGGNQAEAHADGGIFSSPHLGIIGEAGAEAVIPLSSGKRNRGLELLSKIAGNFVDVHAANALPMGGASTVNNTTDTRVNVGTVNISAADGMDAANQFMDGIESRAARWTAAANAAY